MPSQYPALMRSVRKYFQFYSFVSICILCLLYCFTGYYTQESADNIYRVLNTDLFTSHTENLFNNYGSLFLITNAIKYMNRFNANIPYYGLIFIFTSFLFLVNFFVTNHLLIKKILLIKGSYIIILAQTVCFIVLFNSICIAQYTKISLLLYVSTLSLIFALTLSMGYISKYYQVYIAICILMASLLRAEPLFISSPLLLPLLIILYKYNRQLFRSLIRYYIPITLFISIIILLSNLAYNANDISYKNFVTPKVSIWDKGQDMNKLVLQDKSDSVRYWAAKNIFLSDPDSLNPAFFKRIHIEEVKKTNFIFTLFDDIPFRIGKAFNYILSSLNYYAYISYVYISVLILLPVLLFFSGKYKTALWVSLNILFYSFLIYMLAYVLKMEERILIPFAFFTYYTSFLIIITTTRGENITQITSLKSLILIFTVIFCSIILYDNYFIIKNKYCERNQILEAKHYVNGHISGKYVVFNLWAWNLVYADLLDTYPLSCKNTYLSVDNGYLFLYQ